MSIKKQNIVHKRYITASSLQEYLNLYFESKNEDSRSVEDIYKLIIQYSNELKHGCETSENNNRPIIEALVSPLKFLIDALNSFYIKVRGILHMSRIKKFADTLELFEDLLFKEGFQRLTESQNQIECSELLTNAVSFYYFLNFIIF